jgi:hypothetical protein
MNFQTFLAMAITLDIGVSEQLRFLSIEQLYRIKEGFKFPHSYFYATKYRFEAEEIILISLTRLAFPSTWSRLYPWFPGRKRWQLQAAFYWFMDFMIVNWSYLLLNNLEWWTPYFVPSAEAIRIKLQHLNHVNWRQNHPPANHPDGFRYGLFIDNTMFAFCRPGGNITDGPASDRVPLAVQQSWYTGWKKLHGMKWQTVILANGMDAHVWGPMSVRRNDLTTLAESKIVERIERVQENCDIKIKLFGDSAYYNDDYIGSGGGKGMASVRETIEWSYKDIKSQWKYCDYKTVLELRRQPVAKIFFVCLLLRNAYVTLNASQISEYMNMAPPSLEVWLSQGPRAHDIPTDSIFHPDFVPDDALLMSESEDESDSDDN